MGGVEKYSRLVSHQPFLHFSKGFLLFFYPALASHSEGIVVCAQQENDGEEMQYNPSIIKTIVISSFHQNERERESKRKIYVHGTSRRYL